jgi:hypothetical protein
MKIFFMRVVDRGGFLRETIIVMFLGGKSRGTGMTMKMLN